MKKYFPGLKCLHTLKSAISLLLAATAILLCGCSAPSAIMRNPPNPTENPQKPDTARLELNVSSITIGQNDAFVLIATVVPLPEYLPAFTYSSSDESVATVSDDGVVTAVAPGECTVAVTTGKVDMLATCAVRVVEGDMPSPSSPTPVNPTPTPTEPEEVIPIESLELVGPTNMYVGKSAQFTVKVTPENATEKYTLHNSNDRYSTMTEDGLLTATGKGITTVTVETEDRRLTDSITVNISYYIAGVAVTADDDTIEVGQSTTLYASVLPEGTQNSGVYFVFSSAISKGAVTVSSNGYTCKVTGTKPGIVAITVGSQDHTSITKTIWITVKESTAPSVAFEKSAVSLRSGDTAKLNVSAKNISGTLTYQSNNESVATVDKDGTVHALLEGEAVITVTGSGNGKTVSATCTVTVTAPLPEIQLSTPELHLTQGETANVNASLRNATGKLSYESSAPNVVSVNDEGLLTALTAGEAKITVSFAGAQPAVLKVVVSEKAAPDTPDVRDVRIVLKNNELTLTVNEEGEVGAVLEGAEGVLSYESSAQDTVSVDENGKLLAKAVGEAIITVSFDGAESVTLRVTVVPTQAPNE